MNYVYRISYGGRVVLCLFALMHPEIVGHILNQLFTAMNNG